MSTRLIILAALCAACASPSRGEESAPADSAPEDSASAPAADGGPPAPPPPDYEPEVLPEPDLKSATLADQRQAMLRRMVALGVARADQVPALAAILATGKWTGQGNPDVVEHPLTQRECMERRKAVHEEKKPRCGAPFMAPLWNPATGSEADAKVCIDRYEFPGIPCEYPMTWVTTSQAQKLCKVIGKRVCDAHEWEGACAGAVLEPEKEYAFGMPRDHMSGLHNIKREKRWAYGLKKDHSKCATASHRSKSCSSSGWRECGSNSYPAGSFPECRSPFGVYDLHGNVAEHMWLPLHKEELGALGGKKTGVPEMKGSWFIFLSYEAHIDDCRWRAPSWHGKEGDGHMNYHLGFRCCKDI